MFYSLATLLNEKNWLRILDQMPDGREIILTQKPDLDLVHISWIVSTGISLEPLAESMDKISKIHTSFNTVSGGIGIFAGQEPVLTLMVARSRKMCEMQFALWEECRRYMTGINNHYSPDAWMPHITLLHQQNRKNEICNTLEKTVNRDISFSVCIDNLSLIYLDKEKAGLLRRFDLMSPVN